MKSTNVNCGQDVIDSRDVIERIAELESIITDAEINEDNGATPQLDDNGVTKEEIATCGECGQSWKHGETLIRDSYFEAYAQELAEDIGAINKGASWPNDHIDWEAAADALKQDYFSVDFDGTEYWIRS